MELLPTVQMKNNTSTKLKINALSAAVTLACLGVLPSAYGAEEGKNGDAGKVADVVVYGEKTERSLQETSSSVVVFDEDEIKSRNANEARDLLKMTPNVVETGYGNTVPTIRGIDGAGPGIGAVAFFAGTRPRLNISVDGRSLTYNELAFGPLSMWDMQQAEIYLGPQSFIQGRNSIAGSMVLKSNDPTYDFQSGVKLGVGNHEYVQTAAYISDAIIEDQVAFRLSADRQTRESSVDLGTYSPAGNSREIESNAVRAKLLVEPAQIPALSSMLTYAYYDSRAPQGENQPSDAAGSSFSANRPVFESKSNNVIWDVDYDINNNMVFTAKTNYTDFEVHRFVEEGQMYTAHIDGKEFFIEPAVRYVSDSQATNVLVGVRYYQDEHDDFVDGMGDYHDETQTASAYVEVKQSLTSSLDLTAVGRYEHEDRERKGGDGMFAIDFDETFSDFMPKVSLAWKATENSTYGASVSKGYRAGSGGVDFTNMVTYIFGEESVWSYELFSRHRLFDDTLQLTTNLFYNDYDDLQVLSGNTVMNAEQAQTYGAEATVNWFATQDVQLYANLGLLKTELSDSSPELTAFDGKDLARSPAFTGSVGARYWLGDFELSGNVNYIDDYYSTADNDEDGKISGYSTTNLSLAYNFDMGQAKLYANNVFDADDEVLYSSVRNSIDQDSPVLLPERQIGVSVEMHF